jgi:predicted porin
MASGIQAGSRIGFKGSEDLGNGMKAIFEIEQNVTNDASTTAGLFSATSRHAYVGLTGNFGTVVGGRLDGVRYGVFNKYDAFAGGGMGNFTQMTGQVDRADNAIAWISPNWGGFSLVLAHSRDVGGQEVAGTALVKANTTDGRLYTIKGGYDNGPLSIDLDYETVKAENSNALAINGGNGVGDTVVYTIGASYDFGMVKIRGLYDHHDTEADGFAQTALVSDLVDYDDWFISASMPFGNFLFKATYGQINDKRNSAEQAATAISGDATKWGLGVNYNLSKRTNVYLDYAQIRNDGNANYQLSPAANSQQTGYGTDGFNIGLAHNF